jgi:hypothetical protein
MNSASIIHWTKVYVLIILKNQSCNPSTTLKEHLVIFFSHFKVSDRFSVKEEKKNQFEISQGGVFSRLKEQLKYSLR